MNSKIFSIFFVLLILFFFLDLFIIDSTHTYTWYHAFKTFDFLYGLGAALLLSMLAKFILKPLIQRKENYYKEDQ